MAVSPVDPVSESGVGDAQPDAAVSAPGSGNDVADQVGDQLADRLALAILRGSDLEGHAGGGDHLELVRRCHRAEALTKSLTRQAVDAARSAGRSWAEIGRELGMSRQAAQQRFGGSVEPLPPDERWLGPVTALDEMAELELAGRLGWRTIGAGTLRHRMVRTPTQWEHRRLLWPRSAAQSLHDGWQVGCRAFPWIYLVRDTGLPAESE